MEMKISFVYSSINKKIKVMKITDCKIGKKYQINPSGTIGTLMKTENGLGWDIEQEHFYKKCSDGLVRFGTGIDNNDEDTYEDYLEIEE
jgi:hypothetical protein